MSSPPERRTWWPPACRWAERWPCVWPPGSVWPGSPSLTRGLTVADPRARYAHLLKYVMPSVPAIGNSIRLPGQDEGAYPRTPVGAVAQLLKLFKDTAEHLPRVTAPVIAFRSSVDPVVPESSMALLRRLVGGDLEVVPLTNSYHVATMDHDAQLIFDRSHEFIQRVSTGAAA